MSRPLKKHTQKQFDAKWLQSFKGCSHLSDHQATELTASLKQFVDIVLNVMNHRNQQTKQSKTKPFNPQKKAA